MAPHLSILRGKNPIRAALAWGVHLFTASGAVWGFLALRAVFEHDWRMMIFWMILAMFVDGFDGMLARWADVKTYADGLDGALLDNILDYLNYVVVPALFLIEAEILPYGFRMLSACAILLASAYQFTQTNAKTEDHHFKGFPSYWNVVAIYMLILNLNAWINFALLVIFTILVFVPVKYIYPSRNTFLRSFTLGFTYLYGAIGIWSVLRYPHVPEWAIWGSFIYVAYYVILSLLPKKGKPLDVD